MTEKETYDVAVEVRRIVDALRLDVGTMTLICALREAYEAGLEKRPMTAAQVNFPSSLTASGMAGGQAADGTGNPTTVRPTEYIDGLFGCRISAPDGWDAGKIVHVEAPRQFQDRYKERSYQERYLELLYAVERKHPGESRHKTALRYIRQAEQSSGVAVAASPAAVLSPKGTE